MPSKIGTEISMLERLLANFRYPTGFIRLLQSGHMVSPLLPVQGLHKNAISFWPCIPKFMQKAFSKSFSQESLLKGAGRLVLVLPSTAVTVHRCLEQFCRPNFPGFARTTAASVWYNPDVEIEIAVLTFHSGTDWVTGSSLVNPEN